MARQQLDIHKQQVIKWEADFMIAFMLRIYYNSILRIPSTTIDILVSALIPVNLFTLPCQKITVYSFEWWEQKLWLSPQRPSNPQTTQKASVKQMEQSKADLHLTLSSKAEGKRSRHETRCFLYLPCLSAHTHGHIKAFGWRLEHELKSGQSNPAVLLESKQLWCNNLIYAGSQLVV